MSDEIRRAWLARLGRPTELDFALFPIDEAFARGAGATIVTGELGAGSVRAGDELEAVGLEPAPFPVRVARVEVPVPERRAVRAVAAGEAGQVLGLALEHAAGARPSPGQCLAPRGRLALASRVAAEVWLLPAADLPGSPYEQRRLLAEVAAGRGLEAFFHTRAVPARVAGAWRPELGAEYALEVELDLPVAIYPGTRFALRYEGLTFGVGFVTTSEER